MKHVTQIFAFAFCLAVAACGPVPAPEDYANKGDPERMLASSSEIVTVSLASKESLGELSNALASHPPTRAILYCPPQDALCTQAKIMIDRHKIPLQETGSGSSVALLYDRVDVRACDNRYVDNSQNEYNLEPPSFGCSLRSNTVQMVTDKKQFTDPSISGPADGEKAAQVYDNYLKPPAEAPAGDSGKMSGSMIDSAIGQ